MKIIFILLLSVFFIQRLIAQPFNVGELRNKIELSKEDTNRVLLIGRLSSYYNHNHLDSGFYLARQMITLSRQLNYAYGEAWGLSILATSADRTGDMTKSLEIALSCLRIAEHLTNGKIEMITKAYTQIGVVNFLTGHYPESRLYLHKALGFARQLYPQETSYYQIYAHMGNAFRREGILDSALYYTQKAYNISLSAREVFFFPYVRNCEGEINEALGKKNIAKEFYRDAIIQGIKVNHLFQLSYSYSQMSNLFFNAGDMDSCIYFAKKSLELSQVFFFGTFIPLASNQLSLAFERLHQPDSSLKYLRLAMEVRDKVMTQTKQQQFQLLDFEEQQREEKLHIAQQQYRNKIQTILLLSGLTVLLLLIGLLLYNNRVKQKSNKQLLGKTIELEKAMISLRETQSQLIQSEKMASLGQLTAGIAHEIQNPLNFVNNFSEVNNDLIAEMVDEYRKGNHEEGEAIANDIKQNSEKINHHGKRADAIVKGMLQHSQASAGKKEPTAINNLADEYLRLFVHGIQAKDKALNIAIKTDFDDTVSTVKIIPQDIGRVLLNLYNNAFYAVNEKHKQKGHAYEPIVTISTKAVKPSPSVGSPGVLISVKDNGNGIPEKILDKIFQPFFTTKPTGQGTGLGLSLSYDIIKAHGGTLTVETKEGEGTEFIIILPAGN